MPRKNKNAYYGFYPDKRRLNILKVWRNLNSDKKQNEKNSQQEKK